MPPTSTAVLEAVAAEWRAEPAVIVSRSRTPWAMEARDAAVLLLVESAGLPASDAARRVGRHTAESAFLDRARARYATMPRFAARVEALRAQLGEARHGG